MILFRSPLLSALDYIQLGDRVQLQSSPNLPALLVNWGTNALDVGTDTRIGPILAAGSVTLRDRAFVDGSIQTASMATLQSGAAVTGSIEEHATLQLPTAPSITNVWPTNPQSDFTVDSGTQATKSPGTYGNAIVRSNGTLTLSAGTYYFASLLLEAGAIVHVEGATVIEVRDSLTLRASFKDVSGILAPVALRYRGTSAAMVEQSFRGSILAPSAQLVLGSNGAMRYQGQFLGNQIVMRPDSVGVAEIPAHGAIFPVVQQTILDMLGATDGIVIGDGAIVQVPTTIQVRLMNWGSEPVVVGQDGILGPIASIGPVNLGARTQVDGSITTADHVVLGQGCVVTGTITELTTPSFPTQPAISGSWPTMNQGDVVLGSASQETLAPGSYGAVSLGSDSRLILTDGHYWFESLDLPQDALIEIHGVVIVDTLIGLAASGRFVDASNNLAPVQLLFRGTFPAHVSGPFLGSVLAPDAQLILGREGASLSFQGAAFAHQIIVASNTVLLPPTTSVPDIFSQGQPPQNPTVRTFTGMVRLVVPKVATAVPTRILVQGASTPIVIDVSVGGIAWVTPQGNAPWTIVVQTQDAQGVWTNVSTADGNPAGVGGIKIASVVVAAQGGNPAFVIQVQQQVAPVLPETWTVSGTVTWADGQPFSGTIRAYDKDLGDTYGLGGEQFLGIAETDGFGQYTIQFTREQFQNKEYRTPDLFIRASNLPLGAGNEVYCGQSVVVFNVSTSTTLDLVLERVLPSPLSEYERLDFLIHSLLGDRLPESLSLDVNAQFLSNELGESLDRIRFFIQANQVSVASTANILPADAASYFVPATALYGLYRKGFAIQLELLSRRTESDLVDALVQAQTDGIIDLYKLGTTPDIVATAILSHQDKHLSDLLTTRGGTWVTSANSEAFVNLIAEYAGNPPGFWQAVVDRELLGAPAAEQMRTYFSLLQTVGGNSGLANILFNFTTPSGPKRLTECSVEELMGYLNSEHAVSSHLSQAEVRVMAVNLRQVLQRAFTKDALVNHLERVSTGADEQTRVTWEQLARIKALLDANRWIDPRQPLPNDSLLEHGTLSPADFDHIRRDMESLQKQLAVYPLPLPAGTPEERRTSLVAQILASSPYSNFVSPVAEEVQQLLQSAPEFRFGRDKIQSLIDSHAAFFAGKSQELVDEIKRWVRSVARLYSVYPSTDVALQLLSSGYKSAGQIARTSRQKFLAEFDPTLTSDVANSIHRTARRIAQTSIQLHGLAQSSQSGLPVYALGTDQSPSVPDVTWSNLFGRPVSVRVPDWRSILSPAAYFVELLRYLESLDAPLGKSQPYAALIQRRPDLVHIPLDKSSTFDEISHSQLVLEILQAFVVNSNLWTPAGWESITWADIQDQADAALRTASGYPFELPVDVQKHDQELLLGLMDLHLGDLGTTLGGSGTDVERDRLTKATLGLASGQLAILLEPSEPSVDASHLATIWGVTVAGLEDLKTKVARFLDQAEITFLELKQYSVARFSQGRVFVSVPDGADLDALRFGTGSAPVDLTAADLHRANRFFRLLKQLRLLDPSRTVHDLDAALHAFGSDITADSLQKLSATIRISRRSGIGWYQALSLFSDLDTRPDLVEGDDGDLVETLSWYARVYRVSEGGADADFQIDPDTGELLNTGLKLADKASAIRGALGLSADAMDAIISLLGITPSTVGSFSLANLSNIRRVKFLGDLLATDPANLFLASGLLGHGGSVQPEAFEGFLDDWSAISALSIPANTLRYLYRDSIVGTDSVVPLSTQATSLKQSILDGYAAIEAGFAGLEGDDDGALQMAKKIALIGKTLGDALDVDPARVLDLLENRLHVSSTDTKDITYLLGLGPDSDATAWLSFAPLLVRLQKAALFVAALDLSVGELNALALAKADWNDFDLNDFTEALDGTPNAAATAWFGMLFRYVAVRGRIPAPASGAVSPLLALWPHALDATGLSGATGWSAADIQALTDLRQPSGNPTNRIAYDLLGAFDLVRKLARPASTLIGWIQADDGDPALTKEVLDAVRQKFDSANWNSAETKFQVGSRNFRRENLIRYVLQMSAIPAQVDTPDRLYQFFLIDVSVDAAQTTSRIVQGLASIQQFVQRCLLDLEQGLDSTFADFPAVSPTSFDPQRWSWMKNYRVWEANRRVFLFPENYIEPELRPDKSAFFVEFETAISESEITTETVELAFQNYLQNLDAVARLKIAAHCTDPVSGELHVFGRTDDIPGVHYHRVRSKEGIWAGWEKLPVDIPSEHLVPVFNNRRLYLYWLEFAEKPNQPESTELGTKGAPVSSNSAKKHWEISLAWIEHRFGKWSSKTTTPPESGSVEQPVQGSTLRTNGIDRHPSEYRLLPDDTTATGAAASGGGQIPLRLLHASHIENKVAKSKYVNETILVGYAKQKKHWWSDPRLVPKYIDRTILVTEMVGVGTFFSRLDEAGYWSVLRPGGRMVSTEIFNGAYSGTLWIPFSPLVKTELDWVNDSQAWKFEGPLLFMTPASWRGIISPDVNGIPTLSPDVVGSKELKVLLKTLGGNLLLDPTDKNLLFQPPWKPFFFFDEHRSYLVEALSVQDLRKLSRTPANQTAADLLADPNQVDLNRAVQFLDASTVPADQQDNYGEYFSLVNNGGNLQQLELARLHFSPHYHPYSADLLARLVSGGVEKVLTLDSQGTIRDTFVGDFGPTTIVSPDYPVEQIDFALEGSYSLYNWEIFFHIPLLIASRFVLEKKFEDARRWFHFIFDPTTDSMPGDDSSLRFWKFLPFQTESDSKRIETLLGLFNVPESTLQPRQIAQKRQVESQLAYSAEHPFEPHGIARLRLGAYQKAVFMKYLDNLVEWADQLFLTNTRESINEATQIYVLAKDLLGPAPDRVPLDSPAPPPPDYASLRESMDQDGDGLALVEDWLTDNRFEVADQDPTDNGDGDANSIAGPGSTEYFKIPENEKLADFWNVLDDRLYKIRHGLDINGNAQHLSLFSPRLDPSDLLGSFSSASGGGQSGALNASIPLYRFSVILPKALEFCNEVKSFGAAFLSALEKNDAEHLGNLRARQETALHKLTRNIRNEQISEAEIALDSLRKSREVTQQRRDYYAGLERSSATEKLQMSHLDSSGEYQLKAGEFHSAAAIFAALPDVVAGASGFGGSPHVTLQMGGNALSGAANATASVLEIFAGLESHRSNKAGIQAGWERRNADWDFQVQLADKELEQIDSQIQGGESRIRIAKAELASLELQLKNSQEIEAFLSSKFTKQDMYGWMAAKLSGMYLAAYQLAYQLAKQVEACYTFERRSAPKVGVTSNAWDGLRKGLLAGETLAMDLRRLELEYMNNNTRDPEITKSVSLVSLDPSAVIALKTTGICTFTLPEPLFDLDHPGHYYRRIKSVSVTVPGVTGPYSGVNGQLTLTSNKIRTNGTTATYPPIPDSQAENRPYGPIILSSGQADMGMFETNLRDERFLPFEGCGVVDSVWELKVPQASNSFDLDTISDVVLRIQYTAVISTTPAFAAAALAAASLPSLDFHPAPQTGSRPTPTQTGRVKSFSLRHEFADAWHAWVRDPSQPLAFTLTSDRFPLAYRGKSLKVTEIGMLVDRDLSLEWPVSTLSVSRSNLTTLSSGIGNEPGFGGLPFASTPLTPQSSVPADLSLQITTTTPPNTPIPVPNDLILLVRYSAT